MQINVKGISYTFDKKTITEFKAINNASLNIKQGEFITIIGQTGSGKTTFIEHLNGLLKPEKGQIEFISQELAIKLKKNKRKVKKGLPVSDVAMIINSSKKKIKEIKKLRKYVGIVFQFAEYQLFEETIEKDIIFGPISMGIKKEEAKKLASKYLKLVGMEQKYLKISPFSLSGGQKRRVALAGILAMEPDILIFDEPTAGLDPIGEKEMYKIFHQLNKIGKTIIIVTHNLDHALEHSQRTVVFKEGKIVRDDKTINVMYDKTFLEENELEIPQLVDLVLSLKEKGKIIKKVNSIKEFAKNI